MNVLTAAHGLRKHSVFRHTSLRHLVDLVELASDRKTRVGFGVTQSIGGAVLFVHDGGARLPQHNMVLRPGAVVFTGLPAFTGQGVEWTGSLTADHVLPDRILDIEARAVEGTLVLPVTQRVLTTAAKASTSFARSVDLTPLGFPLTLHDLLQMASSSPGVPPPWELIWVCRKPGLLAPMEALTRLLAASAAREFGGPTAIVVANDGTLEVTVWTGGEFSGTAPINDLETAFPDQFYRIFVVQPSAPNELPPSLSAHRFDRIVYVTDRRPESVPPALAVHLKAGALSADNEPYFSCFIPSILLTGPALRRPRSGLPPLSVLVSAIMRDARSFVPASIKSLLGIPTGRDRFESEPLEEEPDLEGRTVKPGNKMERDACRLRLDPAEIARLWESEAPATLGSFHRRAFRQRPAYEKTAERWARAVTNKRVGLAVSGGGATSYRIVALLEMLEARNVPIDVFGGLSGGAALGAYFCRDGGAGLARYVSRAASRLSILGGLLAPLTSQFIETGMDWEFWETTLDDLEVRFVAVTTALPEVGPPEARSVVRGTLGEAVRVSGALPLFFARTVKDGVLYSDGASATPLPARALPNHGADYVIACNSVPGPDSRNPIRKCPFGEFVYRFTDIGRSLDMWVANGFSLERTCRDAAEFADVFVEATPNDASLLEIFEWSHAGQLLQAARTDPRVIAGAAACATWWQAVKPI